MAGMRLLSSSNLHKKTFCARVGYQTAMTVAIVTAIFAVCITPVLAASSCPSGEYLTINSTCVQCAAGFTCSGGTSAPEPCPKGTYNPTPGQSSLAFHCLACEEGTYMTRVGAVACQDCPAGYMCPTSNEPPIACVPGSYSGGSGTACQSCPAGFQCPQTAQVVPTACSNGTYATGNQTECELCPQGHACPAGTRAEPCGLGYYSALGTTTCTACPRGSYCPSETTEAPLPCSTGFTSSQVESECTPCPLGFYCPNANEAPVPCNDGFYTNTTAATTCVVCEAGRDCSTKASSLPCPQGTFSGQGEASCSQCPQGFFANMTGMSHCEPCPPGYSCSNPAAAPTLCLPGFFSTGANGTSAAVCEPCAQGTTSAPHRTSCPECPPGHECSDPTTDPQPCSQGTYSPGGLISNCTTCPAGSYCPESSTRPEPCPSGSYSLPGSSECQPCPAGYKCLSAESLPERCPDGHVSSEGEAVCQRCGRGFFCPTPEQGPFPCEAGTYTLNDTSMACLTCPTDHHCPAANVDPIACIHGQIVSADRVSCEPCPAGFTCPSPSSTPVPCPRGSYSEAGEALCTSCPAGSSCPTTTSGPQPCGAGSYSGGNTTQCTTCPAGYACPSTSDPLAVVACERGLYSLDGDAVCRNCPAGYFCRSTKQSPTGTCPPGTYSLAGEADCTQCPAGFSCLRNNVAPEECVDGEFSEAGQLECITCPPGFACPNTTEASMLLCEQGWYSEPGSTTCSECPSGYACPSIYGDSRVACQPGWISGPGETSCTACPAGSECPDGDGEPVACDPGHYALGGSDACTECPAGSYCPTTTSPPLVCPLGTYSEAQAEVCITCTAGYRCTTTTETLCNVGYWSPAGSTHCQQCDPGHLCLAADRPHSSPNAYPCNAGGYCDGTLRTECPDGMYGDLTAKGTLAEACVACPAGFFCDGTLTGTVTPTRCPDGYFCPEGTGQLTLQACPAGYFSLDGGNKTSFATGCTLCPAGFYCPQATVDPFVCPRGYFCPVGTKSGNQNSCPSGTYGGSVGLSHAINCTTCPVGHYCPDGHNTHASVSPLPCPGGTYNPYEGAGLEIDCVQCPEGRSCPGTGRNDTLACVQGHYCPLGTVQDAQYPCPPGTYTNSTSLASAEECSACPAGSACGWGTGLSINVPLNCSQGHYCPLGTPTPTSFPCPAGTYTESSNLTARGECTQCPERFYCDGGEASPTDYCPAGYYCLPGTQAYFQHPCPAGTYMSGVGSYLESECLNCTAGHYCERASATPTACPAGTYMPYGSVLNDTTGSVASRIMQCKLLCRDETDFVSMNARQLAKCETGCEQGEGCADYCGPLESWPCDQGCAFYDEASAYEQRGISAAAASECMTCPGGFRCSSATVDPVTCPIGTYSEPGSETCQTCPAGFYCDVRGLSQSVMLATKACNSTLYCPAGLTQHENATPCPKGHYCPSATPTPLSCPPGTHNPDFRGGAISDCHPCPAGMYCVEASEEPTGSCDPGYYCPTGLTASEILNGVSDLTIGSYGPQQEPCPAGTFRSVSGGKNVSACAMCPQGYYCPIASQSPQICTRGFYCVNGTGQPTPCPAGTIGNNTGLIAESVCEPCPAGRYCDRFGSWQSTGPCDPGYICYGGSISSSPDDGITGSICPAGGYCPANSGVSQPCPKGTFNNVTGSVDENDCVPCTPGYYCAATRSPGPTGKCSPGYYCTGGSDNSMQYATPEGHYTPSGSSAPVPCSPGTYQPSATSGTCLTCPAGYYCPDFGMETTVACPRGFFCPEGSDSFSGPNGDQRCPIGTYGPNSRTANVTGCIDCPPGKYCAAPTDGTGLTSPTGDCAAGYICYGRAEFSTPGSELLTWGSLCPVGHYCPQGTEAPVPCPPGSYSNVQGLTDVSQCTACPAARYCPDEGMTVYGDYCDPGYYCLLGSSVARPVSNYSVQTLGQGPMEYYYSLFNLTHSATLLGQCGLLDYGGDVCPQGHYCPTGVEAEYNVGFPTYTWEGGPIVCPEGTYANFTGAQECLTCPQGFACFNRDPFDPNPLPCPKGHYCPLGTGANIPQCPVGTFNNRTGLRQESECQPCSPGLACTEQGLSAPDATCRAGYWCRLGAYARSPDPNTAAAANVPLFDADECPPGYFCPSGSEAPTPCHPGSFSAARQATSVSACEECLGGRYCNSSALTQVEGLCDAGFYCSLGATTPTPTDGETGDVCPAGAYCERGSVVPTLCAPGTYNSETGKSECLACPEGFYCNEGADEYVSSPCDAGHYCPSGTSGATQVPCPVGTYLNTTGAASADDCLPCPPGLFCPAEATVQPTLLCAAGWYCTGGAAVSRPSNASAGGAPCQPGQYCPRGSVTPLSCEMGRACTTAALGESDADCAAGFVCYGGASSASPTDGITGHKCEPGYFCPTGSSEQQPCPAGTYSAASGAASIETCAQCTLGHGCPTIAATTPTDCAAGYHCSELGLNTTEPARLLCDRGFYCPQATTSQLACPSGQYQDETGQATCKTCPAGFVCDATDGPVITGTQSPCPQGYYCPAGTGSAIAFPCPRGTVNNQTGLTNVTQCQPCPGGYYCDALAQVEPTAPCHAGYYCQSGSVTPQPLDGITGDVCPEGSYCPAQSVNPTPCPAGSLTIQAAQDDVSDCQVCDPGEYCVGTVAQMCDPGYVCVRGASTPTPTTLLYDDELEVIKGGYVCPNGTYCAAGAETEQLCPRGSYAPNVGMESCLACPPGQLCDELGTIQPRNCPRGYYCEESAVEATPCPAGTYGAAENLQTVLDCTLCDAGHFCDQQALTSPKGECQAGYICVGADTDPAPTGPTTSISGDLEGEYAIPFVTIYIDDEQYNITSGTCPRGHYCVNGTASPTACPAGTRNEDRLGTSLDSCVPCDAGLYCEGAGRAQVSGACSAGYYCPADVAISSATPTGYECPRGYRCAQASEAPEHCPDGQYQDEIGQSTCKSCPAGYICEFQNANSSVTPAFCPQRYYCPEGTGSLTKIYCSNGTYGASTGYSDQDDCVPCPVGKYCNLGIIEGDCHAGFFCRSGSSTPQPESPDTPSSVGEPCPAGYVCPAGTQAPQLCPNGTLVIDGEEIERVTVTALSEDGGVVQVVRNITVPTLEVGAASFDACEPCPAGLVCSGAQVSPCPAGYYCPAESSVAIACDAGHYNSLPASDDPTDCLLCPAGYWCNSTGIGDFSDFPCPQGFYCPKGATSPMPCAAGTWSNSTGAQDAGDCQLCPAGYLCPEEATTRVVDVCPAGYFCPAGSAEARICSAGYYCPTQSAEPKPSPDNFYSPFNASDPIPCPPGHYCPPANMSSSIVIDEFPPGAAEALLCPLGYRDRYQCQGNHDRTSLDAACVKCAAGKYGNHPARAVCFDCEPGYVCLEGAIYGSSDIWTSSNTSYGRDLYVNGKPLEEYASNRLNSTEGIDSSNCTLYDDAFERLLLENAVPYTGIGQNGSVNAYPESNSFICPKGYYCPRQSPYPTPCPVGTYNDQTGSDSSSACVVCEAGTFNNREGQPACDSCGATSSSEAGAELCTCFGLNRVFNPSDKTCTCKPLFISRDGATYDDGFSNAATDCQPIVFDNCPEGSVLNEHGACLDEKGWEAYCQQECPNGPTTEVYDAGLGRCLCQTAVLDNVCDLSCRQEERVRQYIECGESKLLVVNELNNDGSVTEAFSIDLSTLSGIYQDIGDEACAGNADGRLIPAFLMVASDSGLAGGYDVPPDVWLNLNVTTTDDASPANSRRRRRRSLDSSDLLNPDGSGVVPSLRSHTLLHTRSRHRIARFAQHLLPKLHGKHGGAFGADRNESHVSFSGINHHSARAGESLPVHSRARRASSAPWSAQLSNPVVCLELGSVMVFSVNGSHYPVFNKNNLLNRQDDPDKPFVHAPFEELSSVLQSDGSQRAFAYAFTSPGVWALEDSATGRTSVFSVMKANVECPDNGPFFPATSSAQHLLAVDREDSLVVAPDWELMGVILAGATGVVLIVLIITSMLRRYGWAATANGPAAYRRQANLYPMEDMSSKGSQRERMQRINRKALEFDLSDPANHEPAAAGSADSANTRTHEVAGSAEHSESQTQQQREVAISKRLRATFESDFWDYQQQVDLENFTAETLFDLVDERTQQVHKQIQAKSDEVKVVYENIRREASLLKSLWVSKLRLARPVDLSPLSKTESGSAGLSNANKRFARELEKRKALGDRWYHALIARREALGKTFHRGNELYQAVLGRVEDVRMQINHVIALQRFAQEQHLDGDVADEGRIRCEAAIVALQELLIKGSAQLMCSTLVEDSAVDLFGAVLLPPASDGDNPIPDSELRDAVDNGLVSGTYIHASESMPGLFVPAAGTRMRTCTNEILECNESEFVINPRTGRVLPIRGNVAYNTVTQKLFVMADYQSISTHSAPLLYLPWPREAASCRFATESVSLQQCIRNDWTMTHEGTGMTVAVLACTSHPVTKALIPVGGVFTDPITGLATPIRRYLPGPPRGSESSLIVDVDIDDNGDAVPVCVSINNTDLHTHVVSEEVMSGRSCLSSHVSLRAFASGVPAPPVPVRHGVSWVSGLDALCLQSYRACLQELEHLPGLLQGARGDPLGLSSSLSTAVSAIDSQLRDMQSVFKRTSRLKHTLFSDVLMRFAEAVHIRRDGGVLGTLDEGRIPLFVGQYLVDRESMLEVPVLGVAFEAENDRHVPLGGVMHSPESGELCPITIGALFVDGESGESCRAQGARIDPNTGRVVPSKTPCIRQQSFNLTDDDMSALEEELAARRAWQRRSTNQDSTLLRELQRLMAAVLDIEDADSESTGSARLSKVVSHVEVMAETLTSRSNQTRREQKRRKELSAFEAFPSVLTAMLFSNDTRELKLTMLHLQHFDSVLGACKRFTSAAKDADVEREKMMKEGTHDSSQVLDVFQSSIDTARLELLSALSLNLANVHDTRATLHWIVVDDELRASVVKDILSKLMRLQDRAQSGEDEGESTINSLENLISILQQQANVLRTSSTSVVAPISGRATPVPPALSAATTVTAAGGSKADHAQPHLSPAVPVIIVGDDDKEKDDGDGDSNNRSSDGQQHSQAREQEQQQQGGEEKPKSQRSSRRARAHTKEQEEGDIEQRARLRAEVEAQLYEDEQLQMDALFSELQGEEESHISGLTAALMRQLGDAQTEADRDKLIADYELKVEGFRKKHKQTAELKKAQLMQRLARLRCEKLRAMQDDEQRTAVMNGKPVPRQAGVDDEAVAAEIKEMMLEQQRLIASLEAGKRASAEEEASMTDGESGGFTIDQRMEEFAKRLTSKSSLGSIGGSDGGDGDGENHTTKSLDQKHKKELHKAARAGQAEASGKSKAVSSGVNRLRAKLEARRDAAVQKAVTVEEKLAAAASYDSQLASLNAHAKDAVDDAVGKVQESIMKRFVPEDQQAEAARMIREHSEQQKRVRDEMRGQQRDKVMARVAAQKRLAAERRRRQALQLNQNTSQAQKGEGDDGSDARQLAQQVVDQSAQDEEAKRKLAQLEQSHLQRLEELELEKQRRVREINAKLEAEAKEAEARAEADLQRRREANMEAAKRRMEQEQEKAKAQMSPEEFQQFMAKHRQQLSDVHLRLEQSQKAQREALQARLKAQRERRRKAQEAKLDESVHKELSKQSAEVEELQANLEREREEKVLRDAVAQSANALSTDDAATAAASKAGGAGGQRLQKETMIHRVMRARHMREFERLVDRCATDTREKLKIELNVFNAERAEDREHIEERFNSELADIDAKEASRNGSRRDERFKVRRKLQTTLANFDKKTARLAAQLEARVRLTANTETEQQKFELKQRQYNEMVQAFQSFSPESEIRAQYEEAAREAKEAAEEYKRKLGAERAAQLEKLKKEQERLRTERKAKMDAERKRVEAELEAERQKKEAMLAQQQQHKKVKMMEQLRQQQAEELEKLDEAQRQEVVERHRRGLKKLEEALESEQERQRSKFHERLNALKEKKQEARLRELEEQEEEERARAEEELMERELKMQQQLHSEAQAKVRSRKLRPTTPFVKHGKRKDKRQRQQAAKRDAAAVSLLEGGLSPMLLKIKNIESLLAGLNGEQPGQLGDELEEELAAQTGDDTLFAAATDISEADASKPGVQVVELSALSAQQQLSVDIASALCTIAAEKQWLKSDIKLQVASKLPLPKNMDQNAFRFSYLFSKAENTLFVRVQRADNPGQLLLVVLHALAHVKVEDMDSDHAVPFRRAFHDLLRLVCFDVLLSGFITTADGDDISQESIQTMMQSLRARAQASKPLSAVLEACSSA